MKTKNILMLSILFNCMLFAMYAYKYKNNWFESGVLRQPFRISIFNGTPKKQGLIMFVGDSHTEAFELNEYLENDSVRNRGIWGDGAGGVFNRIDSIAVRKPSKIFLMIGVNDILAGRSPEETFDKVKQVIEKAYLMSPATEIYIQSVLPTSNPIKESNVSSLPKIIRLNSLYRNLAIGKRVIYIDLFPSFIKSNALNPKLTVDGLHLNGNGYRLWSSLIKKYL